MIFGELRDVNTMEEAQALLHEWIAAYQELHREYLRLQVRYDEAKFWAEQGDFMRKHLDPFLPPSMQDAKARAAEPKVYQAIAELIAEQQEYNPFP